MEKYINYKDSEIKWLGNIPAHWESFRFIDNVFLRHGYQFRDYDFTNDGVRIVKISQLNPKGKLDLTKSSFIASDRLKSFKSIRVYQDDILMALTGGTIGKIIRVGPIDEPILQNYRVGNFFPDKKKLNKTFLFFLLASQITEEQINYLLNRNGQPNIGKESFKNMFFTLPPLPEQNQIANYLDAKTTAIDKKIKLLQQKTKHYKNYRKNLINEAITKGLDNVVKLKFSGIDWLGSIPEHWQVKRLKDVGKAIIGIVYSPSDIVDQGEGILVLRSSNIQNDKPCFLNNVYVNKVIPKHHLTKVGDILICSRNGSRRLIGKNIVIDEKTKDYTFGAFMTVLRSKNYRFLSYFFKSILFDFQSGVFMTSTINQLTVSTLYKLSFAFPPFQEQLQIADYLDDKTATIDNIVKNIETQISTLKELRKTLINEVVTGKVKVVTSTSNHQNG
ncbi:restriction endonuclease subunit S [Bizionia sp. M204]|uniref:restriction endonuclease subunit S n=1 Tax=Bizionia sp. M204 TaxID=2675331 RepID=UPI00205C3BCA|nr:restriction endonuclease subunit S [Bizionia sp. M204]UPS90872.1 hypothetical protein GMA17_03695 [Bizionia sp. M204]